MATDNVGKKWNTGLGNFKVITWTAGSWNGSDYTWDDGATTYSGLIVQEGSIAAIGEVNTIRDADGNQSSKLVSDKGKRITATAIVQNLTDDFDKDKLINIGDIVDVSDGSTAVNYFVEDSSIDRSNDPNEPWRVSLTLVREDSMGSVYDA
jgi:hypothetical protein